MAIIFLGFDGVIRVPPEGDEWADLDVFEFGKVQMENAVRVAQSAGAKIVVSSEWRYRAGRAEVDGLLGPELTELFHEDWRLPLLRDDRWREVQAWLEAHPEETRYAILDDVEYLFNEAPADMQRRLVLCATATGFAGLVVREAELLFK